MTRLAPSRRRWLAALAVALPACSKPGTPPKPPVSVTIATAEAGEAPYVVRTNGVVEPMQTVDVQSQVQGVLQAVRFREGDEVAAGQVLFEIDPVPYRAALRQAQAGLARDEAQYRNAVRDAERYATLVEKDYVTKAQADQATANAEALKAVLEADRALVESATFNLDNATIRAPVSGKTGSLLVREGNLVRPGTSAPLVVINQIHPILVRFAVPDAELPTVQRYARDSALHVTVTPRGDVRPVSGRLSFVDNGVDTTTGTVLLKARFENRDGHLWPGQFVAVGVRVYVDHGVVMVPSTAVQNGQDGTFVFVVDDQSKAQMQPVQAARTVGDRTIIASGLAAGARVVTDGQARLTPGATVDIKSSAAAGGTAAVTR
jgi:membrane fusion protein, multidrug efflux system